ncbi:N-acetylmuramoyl-L-alanine amidase [candidate division WOR-3 bacterium]|nr:N-acetylmuramoyl-L-alanine amidase [candidate division WOR-3 bacterium]
MRIRIFLFLVFFYPSFLFSDIFFFYEKKRAKISTVSKGDWVYVSLYDFKKVLNISFFKEKTKRRIILNFPEHTLTFVPDNPYYLLDNKGKKMFLPFVSIGGKSFVSLPDIETVLANATDKDVFYIGPLNSIVMDRITFNPDSIILKDEKEKVSFTLTSKTELITSIDDDKKGELKLTLYNAVCKPTLIPPSDGRGEIKKVLLQQEQDKAALSFIYDINKIEKIERELVSPGFSIRITFYKKKEKPPEEVKPKKQYFINKIVIDPGHGGRDPGAVGPTGLTEKEIVLKISMELKKILTKNGFTVLMTRDEDSFVRLRQRSRLANNSGADLFVSIHCNATGWRKQAGGFETFFLSTAKTSWARAVEAKENSVIEFETPDEKESPIEYIFYDLMQNLHLRESSDLADFIQESMAENLTIEDRGVKQANFHVMREIYMPSVLVEAAFISNKEEEKLLQKQSFRKKIARGITDGILKFKKIYEKKLNQ